MKTYIKIKYSDGASCICHPNDVHDMTVDSEGHTTEEVQMAEQEFNALPEFES